MLSLISKSRIDYFSVITKYGLVSIGKRIRELRKAAGIKQIDFAAELGISPSVASEWESGRYEPRLSQLPGIAAALGVGVFDLMSLRQPSKGGRQ